MELMVGLTFAAALLIGTGLGIILGAKLFKKNDSIGFLRIDNSDEDGPLLFLELKSGPHTFMQEKYVTLEVKLEDFISQK